MKGHGHPLRFAKLVQHITHGNMKYTCIKNYTFPPPDTQIQNSIAASKTPTLSFPTPFCHTHTSTRANTFHQ